MPFQLPTLEGWIACAAIGAMMYVIASARSARVRGIVVSLPIPLTLVLWSKPGMAISAGHVLGMALLIGFFWGNWLLYSRARLPIAVSIAVTTCCYALIGSFTRRAGWSPYAFALGYGALWGLYVWLLHRRPEEAVSPTRIPAWVKGAGTFAVCVFFFSLHGVIGPALATAPLVSFFSIIECRKCLRTVSFEFTRNSIAIVAYLLAYAAASCVPGDSASIGRFLVRIGISWLAYFAAFALARLATPRQSAQAC